MSYDHVEAPLQVGGTTLKNRVVRPAHGTRLAKDGLLTEDLTAYHLAAAEGGVGLTILEICSVHPTGGKPSRIWAWEPRLVDSYRRFMDRIRPTGMRVFQQLWHGGQHTLPFDGGRPWAPSEVPGSRTGVPPHAMSQDEIAQVVAAFGAAAARCEQGGLDGVEVHAGHGYLIGQFLSPLSNHRRDEYGVDAQGRLRFLREVLTVIRRSVSPGFPVSVRISAHEATEGGFDAVAMADVARWIEGSGLADLLSVSVGNYQSLPKVLGGMDEPQGYIVPQAAPVLDAVTMPRLVVGRIKTLAHAEALLADGSAELVGMVRAHIADPALVTKSLAGREHEVRPCIGCNQGCVGGVNHPAAPRIGCLTNPRAGRERELPAVAPRASRRGRVVVVGGGPAGLEAARVAAEGGLDAVVLEADEDVGGQVVLGCRAPHRAETYEVIAWQRRELERLGANVRTGTWATTERVLAESPDVVVLATGSRPRRDGILIDAPASPLEGVERTLTSWEAIRDGFPAGRIVVADEVGHYEAVAVAELALHAGHEVVFVTRHAGIAPQLEPALVAEAARARLYGPDFVLRAHHRLSAVRDGEAEVCSLPDGSVERLEASATVLVSPNLPVRGPQLPDFAGDVRVIGDAVYPRSMQAAIADGHRAGLSLVGAGSR